MCGFFDTCPPTHEQIQEAMAFSGRLNPPPIVEMLDKTKMDSAESARRLNLETMAQYQSFTDTISLGWNWTMPMLVHEMRHAAKRWQPIDECDAYKVGMQYAMTYRLYSDAREQQKEYERLNCGEGN